MPLQTSGFWTLCQSRLYRWAYAEIMGTVFQEGDPSTVWFIAELPVWEATTSPPIFLPGIIVAPLIFPVFLSRQLGQQLPRCTFCIVWASIFFFFFSMVRIWGSAHFWAKRCPIVMLSLGCRNGLSLLGSLFQTPETEKPTTGLLSSLSVVMG